eukprot:TRINITY_DN1125_c0_g1_i2.p1 TRINITY_DN1125_c0_g1~~TRINITY_DN1125_c0_g1_i2.p1  ORF type:complete len:566 (+),score=69.66 TRINITY_DN1125_c0_g1_i2:867-2564(+)
MQMQVHSCLLSSSPWSQVPPSPLQAAVGSTVAAVPISASSTRNSGNSRSRNGGCRLPQAQIATCTNSQVLKVTSSHVKRGKEGTRGFESRASSAAVFMPPLPSFSQHLGRCRGRSKNLLSTNSSTTRAFRSCLLSHFSVSNHSSSENACTSTFFGDGLLDQPAQKLSTTQHNAVSAAIVSGREGSAKWPRFGTRLLRIKDTSICRLGIVSAFGSEAADSPHHNAASSRLLSSGSGWYLDLTSPAPIQPPRAVTASALPRSSSPLAPTGVTIHPTAIVHPDAILMEGVEIGPFCTVGPGVQLGAGCKLHPGSHVAGATTLGARCTLFHGAVVGADIPGTTILGDDNSIGYHAVIGCKCQDMKYKEGSPCYLVMGNGNDIRENANIHRSSKPDDQTVVGDHNLIMGACHVAHDCKVGDRNIMANGTLLGGHVVMEDYVHTGGAVAVHQFCHLGAYSFLAGGSMVVRDVPVYTIVHGDRAELRGLNLEGLRRGGFTDSQVKGIRRAYSKLFLSTDPSQGLEGRLADLEGDAEVVADPVVLRLLASVRASFQEKRRGICKFRHWTTTDQ